MQLTELCGFCEKFLRIDEFEDYCPNGLQVESSKEVSKIVTGVTACLELIEAAIDVQADTLIVHHGYFWKGEAQPIVGFKGRRIAALMNNGINLLAYHLPLDAHLEVGNNAQLARIMDWTVESTCGSVGKHDLIFCGSLETPLTLGLFTATIAERLECKPLQIAAGDHLVKKIAWCSGAAQNYIDQAAEAGADVFISGEVSEHTFHFAREMGIHYIAAGHHATERYGVQALGQVIKQRYGVECLFIDIPNPV